MKLQSIQTLTALKIYYKTQTFNTFKSAKRSIYLKFTFGSYRQSFPAVYSTKIYFLDR